MTTTERKGEITLGGSLREGTEECSLLTVSLQLEARSVQKDIVSLAAGLNEYKMRVKNSEKKVDEEKQNGMVRVYELKQPNEDLERQEYDVKVLILFT